MKIRNGFVSNSSSSSFLLLGTIVNDYENLDFENKEYVAILSEYSPEGNMICLPDAEMLALMRQRIVDDFTLYEKHYFQMAYAGSGDINTQDLPASVYCEFGTCDQCLLDSIDELKEIIDYN